MNHKETPNQRILHLPSSPLFSERLLSIFPLPSFPLLFSNLIVAMPSRQLLFHPMSLQQLLRASLLLWQRFLLKLELVPLSSHNL